MTPAYQIARCKCTSCGHVFVEKLPNTIPTSVARCPKCGDIAEVERVLSREAGEVGEGLSGEEMRDVEEALEERKLGKTEKFSSVEGALKWLRSSEKEAEGR